MTDDDGAALAATTYFDARLAGDLARLRSVLAADVDFAGPLGQVTGQGSAERAGRSHHDPFVKCG
jgi:hypothetical protein